ncbi:MAG: hypothetical protein AB1568_01645 [Thermodesulfobacteriota bacterium]
MTRRQAIRILMTHPSYFRLPLRRRRTLLADFLSLLDAGRAD